MRLDSEPTLAPILTGTLADFAASKKLKIHPRQKMYLTERFPGFFSEITSIYANFIGNTKTIIAYNHRKVNIRNQWDFNALGA
jgi:hypothetical protein